MSELLVGVDVGTTACKAAVVDTAGRELAARAVPVTWQPVPTGAELAPATVADAAVAAIDSVLEGVDGRVLAVGVASMGEAGVLLDRAGAPLNPLIAWYDGRDRALLDELAEQVGDDEFALHTGLPMWPQWSLTKHRWQVEHDPALSQAVRRLDVAAWVVRSLGGNEGSEESLASRTGWLNVRAGTWWPEALAWSGMGEDLLAPLVSAGTALGEVTTGPSRARGAVLTVAGHDHLAAAVGADAAGDGDELDSCGTAEALVRTAPASGVGDDAFRHLVDRGITVGRHVLPGRLTLLGATRGGLLLRRVRGLLDGGGELTELDAEAMRAEVAGEAVHQGGDGNVDITGIGEDTTPGRIWRAALEAATGQATDVHAVISGIAGPHQRITAVGGWARNEVFLALRAAQFGTIHRPEVTEAGARGAALLAGVAAGVYSDSLSLPAPTTMVQPEAGCARRDS